MTIEVEVAIIGAGVVGLAIAAEVAQWCKGVFVFERNRTFGLETSSRNSEVIHAGIYYPEDSLKARFCIEGRHLLYELCKRYGIPHRKSGKIILAVREDELSQLEGIYQQAQKTGIRDLVDLSGAALKRLEPEIEGKAGLLSRSTGIIDSHSLLQFFYNKARASGAQFVFGTDVIGIERVGTNYRVRIRDQDGISAFIAHAIVNSAGLNSDKLAESAGIAIDKAGYKLHYCKGEYFSLDSRWRHRISRLIYPTPEQAGLGVHVTLGLDGRMRLGPNLCYVHKIDYGIDDSGKEAFYRLTKRFLPDLELYDLEPEFAGIRPKLQAPGEDFRDFVITHEEKAGFPGLINLIGIESPGLTASPAIARYVGEMLNDFLA